MKEVNYMKEVTYIYMKDRKVHSGLADNILDALRISKEMGALECYVIHADVNDMIKNMGLKKFYNIAKVLQKYDLTYENTER